MPFFSERATISSAGIKAILNTCGQMGLDAQDLKTQAGLDIFDLEHGTKYQPLTLGIVGHLLTTCQHSVGRLAKL